MIQDYGNEQNKKVDAIIQARYSSSRLPGKILKKLKKTLLDILISRLKRSNYIDRIIMLQLKKKKVLKLIKYVLIIM